MLRKNQGSDGDDNRCSNQMFYTGLEGEMDLYSDTPPREKEASKLKKVLQEQEKSSEDPELASYASYASNLEEEVDLYSNPPPREQEASEPEKIIPEQKRNKELDLLCLYTYSLINSQAREASELKKVLQEQEKSSEDPELASYGSYTSKTINKFKRAVEMSKEHQNRQAMGCLALRGKLNEYIFTLPKLYPELSMFPPPPPKNNQAPSAKPADEQQENNLHDNSPKKY